jgi:hypothetical protein
MSSLPTATRPAPCRRLRSKGMLMALPPDASAEVEGSSDGFFWCTHTMNCLGPDGRVADLRRCAPGRDCYQPAWPPPPVA